MARAENYYLILQISSEASTKEIKAAFRRLAREYHPDLHPNDSKAAEHFKLISQAYDVLSDPIKRRRYDRDFVPSSMPSRGVSSSKTAQDFYDRGLNQSQRKEYQKAINNYTKAIELDSNFIDAYVKRCEMRNKLGDNRGVLDDCYQILKIKPDFAKAHYYQGRARASLGSVQSAIQSYTSAIKADKNYAQAYYYRGIAHQDLQDILLAVNDLQTAAELFRLQKNHAAYRQTKKKIDDLNRVNWQVDRFFSSFGATINDALVCLTLYLFNPGGGLLPAFVRLSKPRALSVGLIYGLIFDISFLASSPAFNSQGNLSLIEILLIGIIPFVSLVILGSLIRAFARNMGNLATDIFIAGATLIPLALIILIIGLISFSVAELVFLLLLLGFSYAILTLYAGSTQILNIAENKAAIIVPGILAISSWWSYAVWELFQL